MVVKLLSVLFFILMMFESRVILDGSQTNKFSRMQRLLFESRVILDGSQTNASLQKRDLAV